MVTKSTNLTLNLSRKYSKKKVPCNRFKSSDYN